MTEQDWQRFLAEEVLQGDGTLLAAWELLIELQLKLANLAVSEADRGVKLARTPEAKQKAQIRLNEATNVRRRSREEWERLEKRLEQWRNEHIERMHQSADDRGCGNEHGRQTET